MKVLLDICGVTFLAKDAVSAAKVADQLLAMTPCFVRWMPTGRAVVIGRGDVRGVIEISETSKMCVFKTEADYRKAKHEADIEEEQQLHGGAK